MPINEEIEIRKEKHRRTLNLLNQYATELSRELGNVTFILFGSYARGDFNLWSDIDIIVISDKFKNIRLLDRPYILPELYDEINYADIICWDYMEAQKMLLKPSWKEALKNSITIKDDYKLM